MLNNANVAAHASMFWIVLSNANGVAQLSVFCPKQGKLDRPVEDLQMNLRPG